MKIHQRDTKHLMLIRENIAKLHKRVSRAWDKKDIVVLDVAPEVYEGCKIYFSDAQIFTLDINPNSNADFICDLANCSEISDESFDLVFCTEVLEHTNDPFNCVNEIYRILKTSGEAYITTPFDFRIHNPLPDNWRFTEHGLRLLFQKFKTVEIDKLESSRALMPIQYTVLARKI